MKQRPLIFILLAYLTGLGLNYLLSPPSPYLLISALLLTLAGVLAYHIKDKPMIAAWILLIAVILWGGWRQQTSILQLSPHHVSRFAKAQSYLIKGRILAPPREYGYKKQFILAAEQLSRKRETHSIEGKILVNCYLPDLPLGYNDRLQFWARLRPPPGSNNPGVFSYRAYLARRGVMASASLSSPRQMIKQEQVQGNRFLQRLYQLKASLSQFLRQETSQPRQGILRTILLGEKGPLLPHIRRQFTRAGVVHLLAISGLHLSFIALLIFQLIRRSILHLLPPDRLERLARYGKPSQLAALFTLPCLILYVLLVGGRTATVRALIMVGAYLISLILERERDLYNILALAALLILIWQPSALQEVDFQLSFGIVFFLITAIQVVPKPTRLPTWLFQALLIPLVANLAALPLTALHFQQISLVGFAANILIVPLASLLIPLGLLACLISLLSPAAGGLLLAPAQWLLQLILPLTRSFSQLPSASLYVFPPTIWQMLIFYLALYALLKVPQSRLARRSLAPLLLGVGLIFWQPFYPATREKLRVTCLDVGQGEAALIEFPNGKNMLIDGGGTSSGRFDTGDKIVAPFLRYRRRKRIDTMLLTHPHPDHLNGLKSILRQFQVGEIWEGVQPQASEGGKHDSENYRQFKALAVKQQVPRRFLEAGQEFPFGEVKIEVLHPPPGGFVGSLNDQSLVLKLTYKQVSFLFTGDISKPGQKYLSQEYPRLLASTILKAPHHGAADAYLPKFLRLVNPEVGLFSVGLYNRYRHPNSRVLKAYHEQGIQTYRTDRQGAITIISDGFSRQVIPFMEIVTTHTTP